VGPVSAAFRSFTLVILHFVLLIEILSFIFTSPAFIILHISHSSQLPIVESICLGFNNSPPTHSPRRPPSHFLLRPSPHSLSPPAAARPSALSLTAPASSATPPPHLLLHCASISLSPSALLLQILHATMPLRRASLSGGAPRHRRDSRPPTSFTWRSQAVATAEAAAGGRAPCVRMAVPHDAARCGAPSLPPPCSDGVRLWPVGGGPHKRG
jgi:hypothetical protein